MVQTESAAQAMQRIGCKRSKLFQLLAQGILEAAPRYGREIRIYSASVDRALAPTAYLTKRNRAGPPTVSLENIPSQR